ncbi:MAG: PIN domain-containing protein [Pseudomonadota bacterium]
MSATIARGLCASLLDVLLDRVEDGVDEVLVGAPVRREYVRVMTEKLRASEQQLRDMQDIFDLLTPVESAQMSLPAVPDPDDAAVLASALAARADVFVTGDKPLLDLRRIEGMAIVTPRELYERLRGLR